MRTGCAGDSEPKPHPSCSRGQTAHVQSRSSDATHAPAISDAPRSCRARRPLQFPLLTPAILDAPLVPGQTDTVTLSDRRASPSRISLLRRPIRAATPQGPTRRRPSLSDMQCSAKRCPAHKPTIRRPCSTAPNRVQNDPRASRALGRRSRTHWLMSHVAPTPAHPAGSYNTHWMRLASPSRQPPTAARQGRRLRHQAVGRWL